MKRYISSSDSSDISSRLIEETQGDMDSLVTFSYDICGDDNCFDIMNGDIELAGRFDEAFASRNVWKTCDPYFSFSFPRVSSKKYCDTIREYVDKFKQYRIQFEQMSEDLQENVDITQFNQMHIYDEVVDPLACDYISNVDGILLGAFNAVKSEYIRKCKLNGVVPAEDIDEYYEDCDRY